ncbi:ABC transporter ATP-binding protein [Siminovitchia sp. FSL H7-0308]|jgi:fluoroquinolone transport system ATP-binding protein|uniref:ABC transporter ATP-binding protein n=1 Tax=Siminovitchia sp. FSL H7-0308 TaxID=2921432 RepID=UPI0030EBC88B
MIQVENLEYAYPKAAVPTIKGVNFHVADGEIFGFLGPSGAGKSTLQNILTGMLTGYRGNVYIDNQELRAIQEDFYEEIGVAFEFPNFYSRFTVLENLRFFGGLYNRKTEDPYKLLKMVGLEQHGNTRFSNLSKGMKMRLNFCRALLHDPALLFLDEPTSGLDPVNKELLKEMILKKKEEGKTMIVTTHDMQIADDLCDRVAFIVNGKIALIDKPRNLKLQYGRRKLSVEYKLASTLHCQEFDLDGIGSNMAFIKLIQEKEIETIHSQETTLGNIFVKVTGKSLA